MQILEALAQYKSSMQDSKEAGRWR